MNNQKNTTIKTMVNSEANITDNANFVVNAVLKMARSKGAKEFHNGVIDRNDLFQIAALSLLESIRIYGETDLFAIHGTTKNGKDLTPFRLAKNAVNREYMREFRKLDESYNRELDILLNSGRHESAENEALRKIHSIQDVITENAIELSDNEILVLHGRLDGKTLKTIAEENGITHDNAKKIWQRIKPKFEFLRKNK